MIFQIVRAVSILFFAMSAYADVVGRFRGATFKFIGDETLQLNAIDDSSRAKAKLGTGMVMLSDSNNQFVYFKLKDGGKTSYRMKTSDFIRHIQSGAFGKWEQKIAHSERVKANLSPFFKKNLDNVKQLNTKQGPIRAGTKIFLIPPTKFTELGLDPDKIHFYEIPKEELRPLTSKVYSLDPLDFESKIFKKQFTQWFLNAYQKESSSNGPSFRKLSPLKKEDTKIKTKKVRAKLNTYYRLGPKAPSLTTISRESGKKESLNPGDKFYFVQDTPKATSSIFIVKENSSIRFKIANPQRLFDIINKNQLQEGKQVDFTQFPEFKHQLALKKGPSNKKKDKVNITNDPLRSSPTLKGATGTVNRLLKKIETSNGPINIPANYCPTNIPVFEGHYAKSCNARNNYVQNIVSNLVTEAETYEDHEEKYCILGGLKKGISFKVAVCDGDNKIRAGTKRDQVCKSKEYVTFLYKEMKSITECFPNVSLKEILPIINVESQFNFNAFNQLGSGRLNASGLMQATQPLIKSQSHIRGYVKKYKLFSSSSSQCKKRYNRLRRNPLGQARNVCSRTSIPTGFRNNALLTVMNYSKGKEKARQHIESIIQAYGPGFIQEEDQLRIEKDLARLMHNRGDAKITTLFQMFFYDLMKGQYAKNNPQKKHSVIVSSLPALKLGKNGKVAYPAKNDFRPTKIQVPVERKHPFGNPRLHKLLKSQNLNLPIDRAQLKRFFSSYLYYEGKHTGLKRLTSNGGTVKTSKIKQDNKYQWKKEEHAFSSKKYQTLEPFRTKRELEGGTFLYKTDCHEVLMDINARQISGNPHINCGEPSLSDDEVKRLSSQLKWSTKKCQINHLNSHLENKRICAVKKYPITDYDPKRDAQIFKQCDMNKLRGIAARPLIPYYSENPGAYD